MIPEFAVGMNKYPRAILLNELRTHDSEFYTDTKILKINEDGILGMKDEKEILLSGYDVIILALGSKSYQPLTNMEDCTFKTYVIGDANHVQDAKYAIFDAAKLAISL